MQSMVPVKNIESMWDSNLIHTGMRRFMNTCSQLYTTQSDQREVIVLPLQMSR